MHGSPYNFIRGGNRRRHIVIQRNFAEGSPRSHPIHILYAYSHRFVELILIGLMLIQPVDVSYVVIGMAINTRTDRKIIRTANYRKFIHSLINKLLFKF